MIENKLEQLLANPNQLGAEFDLSRLDRSQTDIESIIKTVKDFFIHNENFSHCSKKLGNINNQNILLDEAINLSVAYAYYFGLDYLHRRLSEPDQFDCKYIRKAMPKNQIDKNTESSDIYKSAITQYLPLLKAIIQQKDPLHFNPALIENDKRMNNKRHFSGQIPKYFQKILSIEFSTYSKEQLYDNEHLITDLLPALTLLSLDCTKYLPMGTYSKTYSINKIRNMCEVLHYTQPKDSDINTSFEDYEAAINCKFPNLLYMMAREDLFRISRLNNALHSYCYLLKGHKVLDEKMQKKLLEVYSSSIYFLPSSWFQEYYINKLNSFCFDNVTGINENGAILISSIDLEGIVFPQVLSVLLYLLFSDDNLELLSAQNDYKLLKQAINNLEGYISLNYEKIMKHFKVPNTFIWDDPSYLLEKFKNKGCRKTIYNGKIHRPLVKEYEIIIQGNDLPFEEIVSILLDSEPRWRYTTIVEENLAASPALKTDWSLDNRILPWRDSHNEMGFTIRYSSLEYHFILLLNAFTPFLFPANTDCK